MKDTVTRYYISCRMGVDDTWRVTDWLATADEITDVVEYRKKTYRQVLVNSYEARKCSEPESKRKRK